MPVLGVPAAAAAAVGQDAAAAVHSTAATAATRAGADGRPRHALARHHAVRRPITRHPSSSSGPLDRGPSCPARPRLIRATQNPDRKDGRGLFRFRCRYSRTRGHGVSRLRPQILLGAIRLDLAVHEEPADGGQCDQEKLLHRATSSFLDVGDFWRPTIHTDRYRSVTYVGPQLPSGEPQ